MAALTQTDIANMALGLLTEAPIDSLDDDDRSARMLNLHYETTREAELLKRVWVFSILSTDVESAETADTAYPYAYALPADCLRPLPPTSNDDPDGPVLDFLAEGDALMLKCSGTRRLRYIANLIDPGDWNALFTEVVAAALAIKVAHSITGKASMIEVAQNAYDRALREASRVNAIMKRGRAPSGTWEQARQGYAPVGYSRTHHGGGWR